MKLLLQRIEQHPAVTIGQLYVDDTLECWTLEDAVRVGPKVPGATAIPPGAYKVILDHSRRFNRTMPHILDVPDFEGVRIHSGNTAEDTEGCVLVGAMRVGNTVQLSRQAYKALFAKLDSAAMRQEPIELTIQGVPEPVA